jgi:hypothetical protein
VTCRSCGTAIAAKAIVCFKCGAPTADLPSVARPAPPQTRLALVLAVVVIATLATWLIPKTPADTWMRYAAWGAVPVVTYLSLRLIRGPRSGKLLRR